MSVAGAAVSSLSQLQSIPERPNWETEWYEIFCGTYEAAELVQEEWMNWSRRLNEALKEMANRLTQVAVPDCIMLGLINKVQHLPCKPGVPQNNVTDDPDMQYFVTHAQQQIHQYWHQWADNAQDLCESLNKVIKSYDLQSESASCEDLLEGMNFERLSLSRKLLQKHDLRRDFQILVKSAVERRPDTSMSPQRELKILLDVLFEGEEEAEKMTDEEAENLVNELEKLDLQVADGE